jgi:hypothetical protein
MQSMPVARRDEGDQCHRQVADGGDSNPPFYHMPLAQRIYL